MTPKKSAEQEEVQTGLSGVKYIIAVGSGKGGVGKSTVSTNLAIALSRSGSKVGLLDADIYGPSQPGMLGAKDEQPHLTENGIFPLEKNGIRFISMGVLLDDDGPVIWRAPMATKMIMQFLANVAWGELDYLLIDLPPGTGDVQLTLAQQAELAGAVIITTPQDVALGVAKKGLKMFEQVNVPILGIIENMSGFICGHCNKETAIFKEGGGKKMAEAMDTRFLGAIPLDPNIVESGDSGQQLLDTHPDSKPAQMFIEIADKLKHIITQQAEDSGPMPENIEIDQNGNLVVNWPDNTQTKHTPYNLRLNCTCAACKDEDTGMQVLNPRSVPLDIKLNGFSMVGRYAVSLDFSDGHNTGIYRYPVLRELDEKDKKDESFSV